MSDTVYIVTVLGGALVLVLGAAYLLDKRRKEALPKLQAPVGKLSRSLLWISRSVLIIAVLALVLSFIRSEITYARLAWNSLFVYILLGIFFQIARRNGR